MLVVSQLGFFRLWVLDYYPVCGSRSDWCITISAPVIDHCSSSRFMTGLFGSEEEIHVLEQKAEAAMSLNSSAAGL